MLYYGGDLGGIDSESTQCEMGLAAVLSDFGGVW